MRVAVIQVCATGKSEQNFKEALDLTKEAVARKARFIALPEFFRDRPHVEQAVCAKVKAKMRPQPALEPFFRLAQQERVFILTGTVSEFICRKTMFYDTAWVISDQGKIITRYRKKNLFTVNIGRRSLNEEKCFLAGKKLATFNIDSFKMGLAICYDLRFPSLFQNYAQRGCDVFAIPSSFTEWTGRAHWEVLIRARAIENLCYVLAPNQAGSIKGGIAAYGNSMIVDPWGEIIAQAPAHGSAVILSDLKKKELSRVRKILPGIRLDRRS